MTCSYEEVTTGGYLPLWFNQPDGAMLFQFLKQPISYHQYTGRKRERIGVNDRMQWEDLGGGTARSSAFYEGAFTSMRVGSIRDGAGSFLFRF